MYRLRSKINYVRHNERELSFNSNFDLRLSRQIDPSPNPNPISASIAPPLMEDTPIVPGDRPPAEVGFIPKRCHKPRPPSR